MVACICSSLFLVPFSHFLSVTNLLLHLWPPCHALMLPTFLCHLVNTAALIGCRMMGCCWRQDPKLPKLVAPCCYILDEAVSRFYELRQLFSWVIHTGSRARKIVRTSRKQRAIPSCSVFFWFLTTPMPSSRYKSYTTIQSGGYLRTTNRLELCNVVEFVSVEIRVK